MIHNLSGHITTFFVQQKMIREEEQEVCCYGMELLLSTLIGFGLTIFVGIIFGNVFFAMSYLLCIVPVRMCIGGYHASTYVKCKVSFLFCFVGAFILFQQMNQVGYRILGIINLLSISIIVMLAPLENKNKKISAEKKKLHKKIGIFIYTVTGMGGTFIINYYGIRVLNVVLLVVTILLILGSEVNTNEKKHIL